LKKISFQFEPEAQQKIEESEIATNAENLPNLSIYSVEPTVLARPKCSSSIDSNYLNQICRDLSKISTDLKEKAIEENKMLKWKYAAICLDKMFFYLALIGFFLAFFSCILVQPKLYNS